MKYKVPKFVPRCRSCKAQLKEPGDIAVKFCKQPACYPSHAGKACKTTYHGRTHASCGPQSSQAPAILY